MTREYDVGPYPRRGTLCYFISSPSLQYLNYGRLYLAQDGGDVDVIDGNMKRSGRRSGWTSAKFVALACKADLLRR